MEKIYRILKSEKSNTEASVLEAYRDFTTKMRQVIFNTSFWDGLNQKKAMAIFNFRYRENIQGEIERRWKFKVD